MKWKSFLCAWLLMCCASAALAMDPMTYKEIAMLVRNGEQQQYILDQASNRKLMRPLTAKEESDLVTEGAPLTLIKALRSPSVIATAETMDAYKAHLQQQQQLRDHQAQEHAERQAAEMKAREAAAQPVEESQNTTTNPVVGKTLNLKFTAMDGRLVNLANLRGKVVLIDFWASWCGPAMMEEPNVLAAYTRFHERGFEVIGISLDKSKSAVQKTIQENGMLWPQYFDGKGWENAVSSTFGIHEIPVMWLVDKNGVLVTTKARGSIEPEIEKLIDVQE